MIEAGITEVGIDKHLLTTSRDNKRKLQINIVYESGYH
jgi:hypothetical protein